MVMKRSGASDLPLHGGKAPAWLVSRMKNLAGPIIRIILDDFGRYEFLRRLSNPYWFQSLGCVLGFDWHSSGVTTVTTGVLKDVIELEEHGLFVAGGKGKASLRTPEEIENFSENLDFSDGKIDSLKRASRLSAKVDNVAIQAGAPLYHHTFFGSEDGDWTVVQQGIDAENGMARRYHWISDKVESFVEEPHEAILTDEKREKALDMTAKVSEECRKTSTDLVKDDPKKIMRDFQRLSSPEQKTLLDWTGGSRGVDKPVDSISLPKRMNWEALEKAYELQPENYEGLIETEGVGPATARGLALVSEIIYGDEASWKDPAKYSFAFGGKDGVPYPVNRSAMDEACKTLESAIEEAEIGKKEKKKAIRRLEKFSPQNR